MTERTPLQSGSFYRRQADGVALELQRAADVCNRRAQRLESMRIGVSAFLATFAVIAALWPATSRWFAAAGAAWTITTLLVAIGPLRSSLEQARTLQEQFDVWLFQLPWTQLSAMRVPPEEIHRLARKSKLSQDLARSWYPDVDGIPRPYDVLACQRVNLVWDARLRRRWANTFIVVVVVWVAIGATVALIADWSTREFVLRWMLPSSALIALGIEHGWVQRELARGREQLFERVRTELEIADERSSQERFDDLLGLARQVQDDIFRLRRRAVRVPNFLYRQAAEADHADVVAAIVALRKRVGRGRADL